MTRCIAGLNLFHDILFYAEFRLFPPNTAMQYLTQVFITEFCASFTDIIQQAQSYAQIQTDAFMIIMQMQIGFFIGGPTGSIMVSIMASTMSVMATIYFSISLMWYSSNFAVSEV